MFDKCMYMAVSKIWDKIFTLSPSLKRCCLTCLTRTSIFFWKSSLRLFWAVLSVIML